MLVLCAFGCNDMLRSDIIAVAVGAGVPSGPVVRAGFPPKRADIRGSYPHGAGVSSLNRGFNLTPCGFCGRAPQSARVT